MEILYFLVSFIATFIGAISGFGGGVIIKPVLDALGNYNTSVIGVLSSTTVLCMAFVSTTITFSKKPEFDGRIIYLSLGAVFGGIIGKILFAGAFESIQPSILEILQASILIVLLVFILFKNKYTNHNIKSPVVSLIIGTLLGSLSAFLGIGGGPFNIAVLCILFSLTPKTAVTASLLIIVFSQSANLLFTAFTAGFGNFSYRMLYFMIPGGILSGLISGKIKKNIPDKLVEKMYFAIVIALILLNCYNILFSIVSA